MQLRNVPRYAGQLLSEQIGQIEDVRLQIDLFTLDARLKSVVEMDTLRRFHNLKSVILSTI
jgi:hypothetical protein